MAILKWVGITLAALVLALVLVIVFMDWNWVKDYVARQVSETTGRTLTIGHLDVDWSLAPRIRLTDIRFANAPWSQEPYMADIRELAFRISLPKLLLGRIVLPELSLLDPRILLETSPQGEPNWEFRQDKTADSGGGTALPTIESLLIKDGRLVYRDPLKETEIDAAIAANEGQGDAATQVQADGRLQGEPLKLRLTGGSLLTLPKAGAPYPLKAQLDIGQTIARLEGTLQQPLQLQGVDLALTAQGGDPATESSTLDRNLPELPPYQIQTRLLRQDNAWTFQDLQIRLGESDLRGTVALEPSGRQRPLMTVKAQFASDTLNLVQLAEIQADGAGEKPQAPEDQATASKSAGGADSQAPADAPPAATTFDPAILQTVNAEVGLIVGRLIAPQVALNQVALNLTLQDGRLRIDPLSVAFPDGGSIGMQLALDSTEQPVQGSAQITLTNLDPDKLMAGSQEGTDAFGTLNGQIRVSLAADQAQPGPLTAAALLKRLRFDDSTLRYQDPNSATDVTATIGTLTAGEQAGGIQIKAEGRYQNQPLALNLQADPIAAFGAEDKPYSLGGNLESKGPGSIPSFQFNTRVARQGNDWTLPGFQVKLGETDLSGDIAVATGGERPLITADLVSQKLDLRPFTGRSGESGNPPAEPASDQAKAEPAAEEPLNLAPLRLVDAKISYQAKEVIAPELPLESLSLQLALNDGRLSVDPLRTQLKGISPIVSRLRLDATEQPFTGTLMTAFDKLDLDAVAKAFVKDDAARKPLGILSGELNLAFTGAKGGERSPDALPYLDRLAIRPSPLSYTDPALKLAVDATVSTDDLATGKIRIDSKGRYSGQAFALKFTGDPLLELRKPQPYSLDLTADALETQARIQGRIMEPLAFKGLDASLALKGPDPALLYPLLGIALPSLPPYSIKGQLAHQGSAWKLSDFDGRVGDSDLHGDIQVDIKGERPVLAADLTSNLLDIDDLGGLVGATPDPKETASKTQQQKAAVREESPTVLSRDPIDLAKVNSLDASVNFRGKRIKTKLPMDDLTIKFELRNGKMTFKPLNFGVGGGDIRSNLELDAGDKPIKGNIEAEFRRIDLKHLLKSLEVADESAGVIGGRAKLWVRGNSIGEFMASADGGLYLLMTGGKLDHLLVELGGLDVAESLASLLGKERNVAIECAYADLHTRDGQMDLSTFVIDTTDTLFAVDGKIDWDQEQLNITIKPYPKDFSPLSVRGPVHINGRFKDPGIRPDEMTVGRVALATILGAVATPVAALLPLIETGPGEDTTYCKGFVKDLKKAESR